MMDDKQQGGMGYGRFAAMVATSTIVMFGLMYLNTYAWSHVEYSQTREIGAAAAIHRPYEAEAWCDGHPH